MRLSSMRFAPHSDDPEKELLRLREARIPQSSLPRLLTLGSEFVSVVSRGWLPNQYLGHVRPLTFPGKPSCDGSTSEFRIVERITQHEESADEKFPGSSCFGLRSTATLCQSFIETL